MRRLIVATYAGTAVALVAHLASAVTADAPRVPVVPAPPVRDAPPVAAPARDPRALVTEIEAAGLFPVVLTPAGTLASPAGPSGATTAAPSSPEVAKKLRLVGTVLGAEHGVAAVLEDLEQKRQILYRLHDRIPGIGELVEVGKDAVLLDLGTRIERLESPLAQISRLATTVDDRELLGREASASGTRSGISGSSRRLERGELDSALADLPGLIGGARFAPMPAKGQPESLRLEGIVPGSFYERLGLRDGDLVRRINDVPTLDVNELVYALDRARAQAAIVLSLVRQGRPLTVTHEIVR